MERLEPAEAQRWNELAHQSRSLWRLLFWRSDYEDLSARTHAVAAAAFNVGRVLGELDVISI